MLMTVYLIGCLITCLTVALYAGLIGDDLLDTITIGLIGLLIAPFWPALVFPALIYLIRVGYAAKKIW